MPAVSLLNRCCKPAALLAALLLACVATAGAQTFDTATPAPENGDNAVIATIVMDAVTEVKLCDVAMAKTDDAGVRTLCRKASADNAQTAIAGMNLAQSLGATQVKFQPAPAIEQKVDALKEFSGREFDKNFLLTQIEADENDEHLLRYAAEFATNAAVKKFEVRVLPKVERSLKLAESALRVLSETAP